MSIQSARSLILANPARRKGRRSPVNPSDFVPSWADDSDGPVVVYAVDDAIDALEEAVSEIRSLLDPDLGYVYHSRAQQFLSEVRGLASKYRMPKSERLSPLLIPKATTRETPSERDYRKAQAVERYTPYLLDVLDSVETFLQDPSDLPSQDSLPGPDPGMQGIWAIANRFKGQYSLYVQNRPPRLDFRAVRSDWDRLADLCLNAISTEYRVRNQSEIFKPIAKAMSEIPYTWREMKRDFDANPEGVHKALLREFLSELNDLGPDRFGPHELDRKWFDLTVQRGLVSKAQTLWDFLVFEVEGS